MNTKSNLKKSYNDLTINDQLIADKAHIEKLTFSNSDISPNDDQKCRLETRYDLKTFPVPSFQPNEIDSVIAFDITCSQETLGDISDNTTNGLSWVDICDVKVIEESNPTVSCLRLGCKTNTLEIGARSFGGGVAKPLHFSVNNNTKMILDTDGDFYITDTIPTINLNNRRFVISNNLAGVVLNDTDSSSDHKTIEFIQNSGVLRIFLWKDNGSAYFNPISTSWSGSSCNTVIGASLSSLQSVDTSAVLACKSTTSGFLPPKMTTTQRDAISSPTDGLMIYNTTTNKLQCLVSSVWTDLH